MRQIDTFARAKTSKRYVHPPLCERMFTLWAEGKILFGDVKLDSKECNIQPEKYFDRCVGGCMWPVYGDELQRFDFKAAKNQITRDGTPIHGIVFQAGDLEFSMEVFCNSARKATLFGRLTAKNTGAQPIRETLRLLLRTAPEGDLVHGRCDGYVSYDPDVQVMKDAARTWEEKDGRFTDGERVFSVVGAHAWDTQTGAVVLRAALAAGEESSWLISFDKGEVTDFDYEEEKAKCTAFWNKEMERITKLPKTLARDPHVMEMVRHMVSQYLQLLAMPEGTDMLLPRQGGLRRIIWPTEEMFAIEGFSRIGDFSDYMEETFRTYFEVMQLPTGEIGPMGIYWASMTAAVIYAFVRYCQQGGSDDFFEKYRANVLRAFWFIKDLRRGVEDTPELAGGLFPILRGIDWAHLFQGWTSTDVFNVLALDALAELFEARNDPQAQEVRREHGAYLADMKRHFKKYYDAAEGSDILRIPLKPVGDDSALVEDFFPELYHGRFVWCGVIDKEEDIYRVFNHMVSADITRDGLGLYGQMRYRSGKPNIWYLSFPDYYWFMIWMKLGRRDKAREILEAQFRHGMSEEYCFVERIDSTDGFYVPWAPNCSAMGRALTMLCKFCEEET